MRRASFASSQVNSLAPLPLVKTRMSWKLPIYIRTLRKRKGLTQKDLGLLAGLVGGNHISRLERGRENPSLTMAIDMAIILNSSVRGVLPDLYKREELQIMKRARSQLRRLIKEGDSPKRERRITFLNNLLTREGRVLQSSHGEKSTTTKKSSN